jgi:hypothetical protein
MSGQQSKNDSFTSSIANFLSSGGSNNSFNQDIWSGQRKPLKDMYGNAKSLYGSNASAMDAVTPEIMGSMRDTTGAATGAWKDALAGGSYSGINPNNLVSSLDSSMASGVPEASSPLIESLNNSLNREFTPSGPTNTQNIYSQIMGGAGNNYADAMKGQYLSDANLAQQNMLSNLDARVGASGMTGSSREGIAQGLGLQGINRNLQEQLARTGYETFDKDLSNKLSIAQQADTNNFNRENMYLNDIGRAQGLGFDELNNARSGVYADRSGARDAMGNLIGAKEATSGNALNFSDAIQNLGMGILEPLMAKWGNMAGYSNTIGGPTVLNGGSGSSWNNSSGGTNYASSAKGKSGGGGI